MILAAAALGIAVAGLVIAINIIPNTPGTALLWACNTEDGVDSPAVAGGTVYVSSGVGVVYALDAATGHVRWTYTTGFYVLAQPAVAGGTVYIGSDDHKVYALAVAAGTRASVPGPGTETS